jgi:hypothetical protein
LFEINVVRQSGYGERADIVWFEEMEALVVEVLEWVRGKPKSNGQMDWVVRTCNAEDRAETEG